MPVHGRKPQRFSSAVFHERVKDASMVDELSISHCLRNPSELLGGRSYGAALGEALIELGLAGPETRLMVEAGGGLGDAARNYLPMLRKVSRHLTLTMIAFSPAMLAAQKKLEAEFPRVVKAVRGDASMLSKFARRADLILSNEAVGDFDFVLDPAPGGQEAQLIEKYGLNVGGDSEGSVIFPSGQVNFVEEVARTLNPGGAALIIEHSSEHPTLVSLEGHYEVKMSVRLLSKVAEANCLEVESGRLSDLLHINPNQAIVDGGWVNRARLIRSDPDELHRRSDAHALKLRCMITSALKLPGSREYDMYLTPGEFRAWLAERRSQPFPHGFENPAFTNPKTAKIGPELEPYQYLILRKKSGT